jgi:hypothetical protein
LDDSSLVHQVPTPKGVMPHLSFTQSVNSSNIESFVNLKKTISEMENPSSRVKQNQSKRSQIKDHFKEIVPDSLFKPQTNPQNNQQIFERTNEIFEEKIGICESKIVEPNDSEWAEVVREEEPVPGENKMCTEMVEACTSDMFQFLLNEILEELANNN